ncbi:DUF1176 domain-containing protein [Sphingobium herbicidovorans]|uniref:DUF1176 domain-containing protein n=1 Tax=Sphingobium herbicidovorans TaxID=76947 RepID=UPI000A8F58BD
MGAKRIFALAAMLSAVTGLAHAQAPRPGTLETYKDWTIGCDNRLRCEAVSLLPEGGDWPDDPVMLGIQRDAGGRAEPEIWVSRDARGRDELSFFVDGRKIATAASQDGEAVLQGPQAAALAIAMARGMTMEVRSAGVLIARPSLAGAAAAMRYMDARQGRAGTMAALIAIGPLSRSAVRPAPPSSVGPARVCPQRTRAGHLVAGRTDCAGQVDRLRRRDARCVASPASSPVENGDADTRPLRDGRL